MGGVIHVVDKHRRVGARGAAAGLGAGLAWLLAVALGLGAVQV